MSIKTRAAFFLAAALALTAPLAHAQESTADPEAFPQVQGTFTNSNIRDCEPNYSVVGVLNGSESFFIVNIESRADGFEYYEIVSADDNDPYSGCVRADVLVPYLDSAVSIDAVKAALNERKIPTLDALTQRWQEGKGASRSRVIPLSTVENDGKVPERLTADIANQLLEQAQAQGIEGAVPLVVHNGGTGESLEYAVIVVDSEGNPYYQVDAADNQAAQDQESHLEALAATPKGTMAIEFTPSGPRFVGVNEFKQVIYQLNLESEEWEALEVPEFGILSEDEMQGVKDFLVSNEIIGEVGEQLRTRNSRALQWKQILLDW